MRESLLTIPISEVFEPKTGCPICRMRNMLEARTVEYIMGAAMMEPDVRIETNKLGFCNTHFHQMLKQKNRLSLALMLQTHIDQCKKELFERKKLFESKSAKKKYLSDVNQSCFVCSKVDWGMERLLRTFFEMYEQRDFAQLFSQQEYICMPHFDLLMSQSEKYLAKNKRLSSEFEKALSSLVKNHLELLSGDVAHFCKMYDYRSSNSDEDWGNARDSIERSIMFLTSRD